MAQVMLMRELGVLMNSIAGTNPNDDVAILSETLKRLRTLDPQVPPSARNAGSHPVSQPRSACRSPIRNALRASPVHLACLTAAPNTGYRSEPGPPDNASLRELSSQRKNTRARGPRRRVSSATKEPIPTEKLTVLEHNFKKHHYVSPEVGG
jgi:hypothetical protein